MIDCPACAGPTAFGGGCATCQGVTEVTQEIHDAFIELRDEIANAQVTLAIKIASLEVNDHERDILMGYGFQVAQDEPAE